MNDTAIKKVEGITVKEAAYILQVAEKTIYDWIKEGKLPGFRVMGNIRIKKEDIGSIIHSI